MLNIFDIHKKVYEPHLQCFYCGKPDYYEIKTLKGKKQKQYFIARKSTAM